MLLLLLLTLPNLYAAEKNSDKAVFIFGGDVSFAGIIGHNVKNRHCTYNGSFVEIRPYLADADHVVFNLESPFGDVKNPPKPPDKDKLVHLLADPKSVEALKFSNVSAVSLANNHFMDYGEQSMIATLNALNNNKIQYFGVTYGKKKFIKQDPIILSANGISVGLFGYCIVEEGCLDIRNKLSLGAAIYSNVSSLDEIKRFRQKKKADVVVVFFHGGTEYTVIGEEGSFVRDLAPYVDVIIGSHPHVTHGHFYYNNTLVLTSLGNFLFPMHLTKQKQFNPDETEDSTAEKEWYNLTKKFKNPSAKGKMIRLEFDRNGLVKNRCEYLSTVIDVDENHCLYTKKNSKSEWKLMCSQGDNQCIGVTECNHLKCSKKKKKQNSLWKFYSKARMD